jgi:hypothetical protein
MEHMIRNQTVAFKVLLFFLISVTLFSYYTKPSIADNQNNIEILDVHTDPLTIHVGDIFTVAATVVNNSTKTISFNSVCISPLSVDFDKNVSTENSIGCYALSKVFLKPGENMTVTGPSSSIQYNATSAGTTNANMTFSYDFNGTGVFSTSKSFSFTVYENNTGTNTLNEAPLKQVKSGISPHDVKCNDNMQLVFKIEDKSPACVKPQTIEKLVARGWAVTF